MNEHIIEVASLRKTYGKLEAVAGVSFHVERGEIFGILGPNGAGKTTTLEIIERLKRQTSGNIAVLGFDNLQNQREIKARIGVQLQSSGYLPMLSLGELLGLFAGLYGKRADAAKVLTRVGLGEKIDSQVKELSGGQARRFTIATAIVHDPEIVFLDEPTTGLDPHARHEAWELIRSINENGTTVVMTTHYMEEAEYLCDRVAIMDGGVIVKTGTPKELVESVAQTYRLSFFVGRRGVAQLLENLPGTSHVVEAYPKISLELESPDALGA